MPKTITVKEIGKASAAPDLVVLTMGLESQNMDYEKAMSIASDNIEHLNKALEKVGFEKKSVKTTNFNEVHKAFPKYDKWLKDNGSAIMGRVK